MPIYIQLSNWSENGVYPNIEREIKKFVTDTANIVFIASDPNSHEKTDRYAGIFYQYFINSGMPFQNYKVIDSRKTNESYKDSIQNDSCVFLTGGLTLAQRDFICENDLLEPLRKHRGIIIGMSAGAINMAKFSMMANPMHPPVRTFEGIGLVDTTVIPHFNRVSISYLTDYIFPFISNTVVYGLCDDAAIITQNRLKTFTGTIYRITDGGIELLEKITSQP